ncbi:MAG: deoxyribonuclease IV, partial [Thermoplasmata archaeon]
MLLGAHVSISGGLQLAPERAMEIGCETIQIFSKNQRRWKAKPLTDEVAEAFKDAVQAAKLESVVIHDSYLINLADPLEEGLRRSREAFVDEMERAQRLGVEFLIFHPGTHKGAGEDFGIKRIAESVDYCLGAADAPGVVLLLESTAGQGSSLGYTFDQLRAIREAVDDPSRVGYCLDTCHLFAAGYDIRDREGYERVMKEASEVLGLERVRAFHLNDSKRELKSRVDRHEHIGKGEIGLEAFRILLNDSRFEGVPMVLET